MQQSHVLLFLLLLHLAPIFQQLGVSQLFLLLVDVPIPVLDFVGPGRFGALANEVEVGSFRRCCQYACILICLETLLAC